MRNTIIQGSVLDAATWEQIPDQHMQTCITSPPYWGLRDYGVEGQLGLEKTPDEFIEHMVEVFRHVWDKLRDDGTLWLNLGDSYAAGKMGRDDGGNKSGGFHGQPKHAQTKPKQRKPPAGLKPKDLCGIPWRVALALQADGWYLRQDIIWHKPNPMPESVRDRCTKAHEYLFLLTKKPRYFCDMEAMKEPFADDRMGNPNGGGQYAVDGFKLLGTQKGLAKGKWNEAGTATGRNKRSVWKIATAPYKEAHFATFPPKLIEPCVLAGTSEKGCCPECGKPWVRQMMKGERVQAHWQGTEQTKAKVAKGKHGATSVIETGSYQTYETTGWKPGCKCGHEPVPCIVFDPFMGSGTTGMVAKQHGRDYLGIELNAEYIELINKRIATAKYIAHPLDTRSPTC